jgi:hypothetical protein
LLHIAERCKPNHNSSAITFGRMPSEIVLRARRLVNLATDTQCRRRRTHLGRRLAIGILFGLTALISLVWIPSDPLASPRSIWSPWPHWSAKAAHCFGCNLRDYEQYDRRSHFFEIVRKADQQSIASAKQSSRDVTSN